MDSVADVAVVVVAHDSGADLVRCVESLERATDGPVETVVVDHASRDGSIEALLQRFPATRLVRTGDNPGFAAGCNRGIEVTGQPLVLLLNPDAALRPGALASMTDYLERHPDVGILGPRLLHPDGSLQTSAYRAPGLLTETARITRIADLVPRQVVRRSAVLRRLLPATGHFDPHDRTRDVEMVTGACMLVRRQLLQELGGLDEGYFLYYEEIDLCLRAREHGWRIVHLPAAKAAHRIGGSTRRAARLAWAARHLSRVRFHRLHGGAFRSALICGLVAVALSGRLVLECVRGARGRHGSGRDRVRPGDCLRVLSAVLFLSRGPSPASRLPVWLGS